MSKVRIPVRQWTSFDVTAGADKVVYATPLPPGTLLKGVNGTARMIATAAVAVDLATFIGFHGYVVRVPDPDTAISLNTLWDTFVKKDLAMSAGAFDLDENLIDDPVDEPGHVQIEHLMGFNDEAHQVFERLEMLTFADSQGGFDKTAEDYRPVTKFRVKVNKPVRVTVPSYLLFGASVPALTATNAGFQLIDTDSEWYQMAWMDNTLRNMAISLAGLVEAGAETPYVEGMTLVGELLERVIEETAADFTAAAMRVITRLTATVEYPGMPSFRSIDSK